MSTRDPRRPLWKQDFDARRLQVEGEAVTAPPRWHARVKWASWALVGVGAYLLLFRTSWGDDHHVFTGLQRLGSNLAARLFRVSDEVPPIPSSTAPPSSSSSSTKQEETADK